MKLKKLIKEINALEKKSLELSLKQYKEVKKYIG